MIARRLPTLLALLLLASPAAAQAPGYKGPSPLEMRARYRADVLVEMNRTMADWADAWSRDDLDALEEVYAEDAVVFPPEGSPLRGWPTIREWLAGTLPGQTSAEAFLQDFDVGGEMAMSHSVYRIQVVGDDGPPGEVSGELITVVMRQGRRWRIRSQVFRQH